MKKKFTIGAIILSIAGGVSAFTWVPGTFIDARDFMIAPSIEATKKLESKLINIMASMKKYDISTDEWAEVVFDVKSLIKAAEKELLKAPSEAVEGIKRRIKTYEQIQQKNLRKLKKVNDGDEKLLTALNQY